MIVVLQSGRSCPPRTSGLVSPGADVPLPTSFSVHYAQMMHTSTAYERREMLSANELLRLKQALQDEILKYREVIRGYSPEKMERYGTPHLNTLEARVSEVERLWFPTASPDLASAPGQRCPAGRIVTGGRVARQLPLPATRPIRHDLAEGGHAPKPSGRRRPQAWAIGLSNVCSIVDCEKPATCAGRRAWAEREDPTGRRRQMAQVLPPSRFATERGTIANFV